MKLNNFILAIVSLALSLGLWFVVGSQYEAVAKEHFFVHVTLKNLAPNLIATDDFATNVVLEGKQSSLALAHREDFTVIADMSGVTKAGIANVPLRAAGPSDLDLGLTYKTVASRLNIFIDQKDSVVLDVHLVPTGEAPKGVIFDPDNATITPSKVKVTGAKSDLANISQLRAVLNLQTLTNGATLPVPVIVYGHDGEAMTSVTVEPGSVVVDSKASNAPTEWSVLVNPVYGGTVPSGYEVTAVQVLPSQVVLKSTTPGLLSGVSKVGTAVVKLDGLMTTTHQQVAVMTDTGVAADPPMVDVVVHIAPIKPHKGAGP